MKVKLDENIPISCKKLLQQMGHNVSTVKDENLLGCTDKLLFEKTNKEKRLLITQDLDFADIRKYRPQTHSGILIIKVAKQTPSEICKVLRFVFSTVKPQLLSKNLAVADNNGIRIRTK